MFVIKNKDGNYFSTFKVKLPFGFKAEFVPVGERIKTYNLGRNLVQDYTTILKHCEQDGAILERFVIENKKSLYIDELAKWLSCHDLKYPYEDNWYSVISAAESFVNSFSANFAYFKIEDDPELSNLLYGKKINCSCEWQITIQLKEKRENILITIDDESKPYQLWWKK